MKDKGQEKGIAHIGMILAIIVVVAAVAFGGWWVWQKNKDDDKSTNNTPHSGATSNQSQEEPPTKEKDKDEYLVIKEWGVRLPLTNEIKDAYYEFREDGLEEHIYLYDKAFDALKNAKDISCGGENKNNFYAISRIARENLAGLSPAEQTRYENVAFTDKYSFKLSNNKALIYCLYLNPEGPYEEHNLDHNIETIANQKTQEFSNAYTGLKSEENE